MTKNPQKSILLLYAFLSLVLYQVPHALSAQPDGSVHWQLVRSGGSTIELPDFLVSGWSTALFEAGEDMGTAYEADGHPMSLRQYRTNSTEQPYAFLSRQFTNIQSIEYSVDKSGFGVISGYLSGRGAIFYGACVKPRRLTLRCIDIEYAISHRQMLDPVVSRISKSFLNSQN